VGDEKSAGAEGVMENADGSPNFRADGPALRLEHHAMEQTVFLPQDSLFRFQVSALRPEFKSEIRNQKSFAPFPGNGRFFTSPCYFRASDEKFRPPRINENDRSRQPIRATASPCDPCRSPRSGP
jgi:hypothetical protein